MPDPSRRPYILLLCFFTTEPLIFQTAVRPPLKLHVYQRWDPISGTIKIHPDTWLKPRTTGGASGLKWQNCSANCHFL